MKMMRKRNRATIQSEPCSWSNSSSIMMNHKLSSFNVISALCVMVVLSWHPTAAIAQYKPRHCSGAPHHVHLAVGRDPATQMTVSFSSFRSFMPSVVGGVMIGTESDQLNTYIEEEEPARFYNSTPPKPSLDHYHSFYQHHVRVKDLEPSTTYYYRIVLNHENNKIPAALRGNPGHNDGSEYMVPIQEGRAANSQEGEIVDDGDMVLVDEFHVHDGERLLHRRLELVYYDSSHGPCPPSKKIRSFTTAPPVGTVGSKISKVTGEASLKFAYIGDIGQFEHSIETVRHLSSRQKESIQAIMLAGDIAYTRFDCRRWDSYFDFMDDFFIVDEIPMHICAGNHDIEKQENDGDIFLAFEHRFRMPQVQPAQLGTYEGPPGLMNMDQPPYPLPYEYGNSYYAFSYGMTHNIFLNAYASMEPNSTQYHWLVQELESVDRTITPWLIVTIHVPVYNTFEVHRHDPQIFAAKEHIEPLYVQYKVNLVVTGHIHAYQRTKNVALDKEDPTGPVHLVVGAGGRQVKAKFFQEEPEPWVAVRDATRYGYGTLEIFNKTHALWEWIITGESEYQSCNVVKNSNTTLPPLERSDSVMLENQLFITER